MNGLLITVIIIFAFSALYGYSRGFIRIVFSLLSMILVLVLVSWITPYTTDFLKENTKLYDTLQEKCTERVQIKAMENMDDSMQQPQDITIAGIKLPEVLQKEFLEQTANNLLEETGVYQQAGSYLADWMLKGITFFIVFILVNIILRLIVGILDLIAKLPVIKGVNRLLGLLAGLIQGLLIVWLLLFFVTIFCTNTFGQQMLVYIEESNLLTFLYHNNGVLLLLNHIFS